MSTFVVKGEVSRIALCPFPGPISYIRIDSKTYEFTELMPVRSVLAMTQAKDHVELTFEDKDHTLILVHIHNRLLEESAGYKS